MNLEGSKSTLTHYHKAVITTSDEGIEVKKPSTDYTEIKGILLPQNEDVYITQNGQQIKIIYKYLVRHDKDVNEGDYIYYNNDYFEITSILDWKKYKSVLLKVCRK